MLMVLGGGRPLGDEVMVGSGGPHGEISALIRGTQRALLHSASPHPEHKQTGKRALTKNLTMLAL